MKKNAYIRYVSDVWKYTFFMCLTRIEQVELLTGRTHQIRGQLSAEGCPIYGDLLYGLSQPLLQGASTFMVWANGILFFGMLSPLGSNNICQCSHGG